MHRLGSTGYDNLCSYRNSLVPSLFDPFGKMATDRFEQTLSEKQATLEMERKSSSGRRQWHR